jgi:hypothetical protein
MSRPHSNGSTASIRLLPGVCIPLLLGANAASAQPAPDYTQSACEGPYNTAFGQAGTAFFATGDDVVAQFNNPFPFNFYGEAVASFTVSTNGFMVANPGSVRSITNLDLPTTFAGSALYPFWDDLQANVAVNASSGIYGRVDGAAPNRVATLEWYQFGHFSHTAGQEITFQVRLFETSNVIEFHYLDVIFGGTHSIFDQGLSATVGLEGPLEEPRSFVLHSFNSASLTDGQCIRFTPTGAPTPSPTPSATPSPTPTPTATPVPTPIPVIGGLGALLLATGLGFLGLLGLRRRG